MNIQETSKNIISDNGNKQRIYLASPYTHKDEKVMASRYEAAVSASAELINKDYLVFSPIVHCHPIAVAHTLPRGFDYWQSYSISFLLYWAEAINILCLDNWEDSIGVRTELTLARKTGLFIYYTKRENS